ncbi:MAG: MBL fold metallo-hydrolase [Actinomycetota bacterium]|nr:MBL fold metallo-hydrolase [Actinomycetota bacterium]
MSHPAYGLLRQVTSLAAVVLAPNPSPMTLEGTNTWILRMPLADESIVVDPGPDVAGHLRAVHSVAGRVSSILLTHGHFDHSEGAKRLHEMTGAPVRALDPSHRLGAEGLDEGDVVVVGDLEVRVWSTPGHTSDSLSFLLGHGTDTAPAVLTGDTILGRGTTVVAYPDGDLADYLDSLRRLQHLGDATVLTGHGPELPRAGEAAAAYLAHREQRLDQVRVAVAELCDESREADAAQVDPHAIVERVYADVDRVLWPAAEMSVRAQLKYLSDQAG